MPGQWEAFVLRKPAEPSSVTSSDDGWGELRLCEGDSSHKRWDDSQESEKGCPRATLRPLAPVLGWRWGVTHLDLTVQEELHKKGSQVAPDTGGARQKGKKVLSSFCGEYEREYERPQEGRHLSAGGSQPQGLPSSRAVS